MRIGIDASFIHFAGVGRYIRCLLWGFKSLHLDDLFYVYVQPGNRHYIEIMGLSNLRVCDIHFEPQSPVAQCQWKYLLERDDLEIFHAPHYVHPLWRPKQTKLVISLHDAVYYRFPPIGLRGTMFSAFYYFFMQQAVKNADQLITGSDFSRIEISSLLKVNASRFKVIPDGLDPNITPVSNQQCRIVLKNFELPEQYFLFVGTNKPWKNLDHLLSAFADTIPSQTGAILVIAGIQGRNNSDFQRLLNKEELLPYVRILGEVTELELRCLYSSAVATLVPSIYEGFGYTALEAMGCKCPIISSTAASLPEVVGDVGILLNPDDTSAWTNAMLSMLKDGNLRQQLRSKGYERSQTFSVEVMAKKTYQVYVQSMNSEGQ
jgi:glycosyltransferase involved in cell wall biosynthesis